jgi:hypothetical protein
MARLNLAVANEMVEEPSFGTQQTEMHKNTMDKSRTKRADDNLRSDSRQSCPQSFCCLHSM